MQEFHGLSTMQSTGLIVVVAGVVELVASNSCRFAFGGCFPSEEEIVAETPLIVG